MGIFYCIRCVCVLFGYELTKKDKRNFEVAVIVLRQEESDFDRESTERRFKGNA